MTTEELEVEFDRQVNNLLEKDYPKLLGLSKEEFLKLLNPLKEKLSDLNLQSADLEVGTLPFVIVVKANPEEMMEKVQRELAKGQPASGWNKPGVTKLFPHTTDNFQPTENAKVPNSPAYLLTDIDRGKNTLNIPPSEALKIILADNRLPLTIDEGIAIITQYPYFLKKNNCFSLLGSRAQDEHSPARPAGRSPADKRVPAIWINTQKSPNLGWCWDGNPHTWLGSASALEKISI